MNQSFDATTIIFAVLAVFIVWKLRSVLGTRTGEERPPFNPFLRRDRSGPAAAPGETGRVVPLPGALPPSSQPQAQPDPTRWRSVTAPEAGAAAAGLDAIATLDPAFDAQAFLGGAKGAYEMIVGAYARGDRAALKGLLAKDVFDGFSEAIAAREARGETVQHTFVALDKALVEFAQVRNRTAQITVQFESQQINAVHDRAGALAEAGSDIVGHVVDHWTFAREAGARDPNWTLVATQAD